MYINAYIDAKNYDDFLNGKKILALSEIGTLNLHYDAFKEHEEFGNHFEFLMHVQLEKECLAKWTRIRTPDDTFYIYEVVLSEKDKL